MRQTRHHRKAKINGGSNQKWNISYVPDFKHRALHVLFQTMTPYEIADELNKTWLDTDYKLVVKRIS